MVVCQLKRCIWSLQNMLQSNSLLFWLVMLNTVPVLYFGVENSWVLWTGVCQMMIEEGEFEFRYSLHHYCQVIICAWVAACRSTCCRASAWTYSSKTVDFGRLVSVIPVRNNNSSSPVISTCRQLIFFWVIVFVFTRLIPDAWSNLLIC